MDDAKISSVREQVSPEEWALRVDLAAAYRLVLRTAGMIWCSPTFRRAFPVPSITS